MKDWFFFSSNEIYLIIIMATIFDNIILDEIENSKISFLLLFLLSCSIVEGTNKSERKKKIIRDSRERQRERERQ